jgi:uncharacterized metal-binding protein
LPNAPTHDLITLVTAAGADAAYFHLAPHPAAPIAALFTATYLFAGYACAGDLDLNSREYRRWGLLRFLWWPYRSLVPHRSWISHGLILGGVIRVAYLAAVTTAAFWLGLWAYSRLGPHVDATLAAQSGWSVIAAWTRVHPGLAGAALAGFVLAGTAHSLADILYSRLKRASRRARR